jgi:iron complex outermembrane recepter protein
MNGQIDLFGRAWKWAVDTSGDYNYRYADGLTPMQSLGIIQNSTVPAAIAYYNIFADHAAFPNTAAANSIRASSHRENSDFVWLGEVTVRANGELIDLPGGTARASFVASGREQKYENDFVDEDDGVLFPSLGIAYSDFPVPGKTSRQTAQVGGELVVPVLGRDFRLPGAREFDLVAAYSRNSITDAKPYGTTNFGLRWAPMADVNFRASFGRGTYPPNDLASFTGDAVLTEIVGATTPDPRRGNSPIGTYTQRSGGNPDLHPESTRTINLGLILQPRRLKGLSATFDYGYIEKKEGIQTLPLATLLANEAFYPERITRAAPTAADAAVGWAGQITQIDVRRTNIGNIWSQYLDTSIRYYLETSTAGNFNFIFRSTNTREYRIKLRPESPITDTLDQISSPLHFRGSGSVAWRKGAWTVTPAFVYIESFRDALNVPVDDSLSINLQLTYEIPASTLETVGRRRWLAGTQWTIGCNNIADAEPPYVQNPGGQSIAAYYSTYDDPRGRYFYVRVRKSL